MTNVKFDLFGHPRNTREEAPENDNKAPDGTWPGGVKANLQPNNNLMNIKYLLKHKIQAVVRYDDYSKIVQIAADKLNVNGAAHNLYEMTQIRQACCLAFKSSSK